MKENFMELLRYTIVGGIAFIADAGVLHVCMVLFPETWLMRLYISTAAGFAVGLTCNYMLSLAFVFKNAREKTQGRKIKVFFIFAVIGMIGFGLTELGMHIGVVLLSLHYLLVKVVVAGLVMLWNYFARKIIIFT